jgi:hypothetical protein
LQKTGELGYKNKFKNFVGGQNQEAEFIRIFPSIHEDSNHGGITEQENNSRFLIFFLFE